MVDISDAQNLIQGVYAGVDVHGQQQTLWGYVDSTTEHASGLLADRYITMCGTTFQVKQIQHLVFSSSGKVVS